MRPSLRGLLTALFLLCLPLSPDATNGDASVLAARDAFARGDRAALARQIETTRGHVLEPWVDYWSLRQRLDEAETTEIEHFLAAHEGTLVADRLRGDWLKQLALEQRWESFDRQHARLVQSDQEIDCLLLQRRHARGDAQAAGEARALWQSSVELPAACTAVMEALIEAGTIEVDDVWQRLRRLIDAKRPGAARAVAASLPEAQRPDARLIDAVVDNPLRHLNKLKPNFAVSRAGRELAMGALARLARNDVEQAAAQWESLKGRFGPADRAWVYGRLAHQAALRHLPQALSWYQAAGDAGLSDEQSQWKVRAALRAGNWKLVRAAIEAMPAHLAEKPDWIYWRARALQAQGRTEEALPLYESIAQLPNFYGNLASDELGRPILPPPRAAEPSAAELAQVSSDPAVRRVLALYRLELRTEGVREWSWALRGRDDRFLLAAAEYAQRNGIFDRAISAADRTQNEHDYALRYLAPFRDSVEPHAREQNLDRAWVYGLMRQESRFVTGAKSSAGAQGLMQLMPATAKWVARKTGRKDFHPSRVNDIDTNVALGTTYLRIVYESLDNHPVLASAAYNAGPGRAQRWRDDKPLEGAIYAETIPLSETRDYVKKVMSNAVYYAALLEGRPQSLKSRLGTIRPAGRSEPELAPEAAAE
jgi:soluble lytic murein transglycosylase